MKRLAWQTVMSVVTTGCAAAPALAARGGPDFNGDGFDDLVVSAIGEHAVYADDIWQPDGVVHVIYGSATGLTKLGTQVWHQEQPDMPDDREVDDEFGRSLATGDFDGDGFDDLVIGVPGDGAVHVLYGSVDGVLAQQSQFWQEDLTTNYGGNLIAGDFNGDGRDDLGIQAEYIGLLGPGVVRVLYGTDDGLVLDAVSQLWHQDIDGLAGSYIYGDWARSMASGDFNHDGYDDLVAGQPEFDSDGLDRAGRVHIIYGSSTGLTAEGSLELNQNTPGIANSAEKFDHFGRTLTTGDFNGDQADDLAIGVAEHTGSIRWHGAVHVVYGGSRGLDLSHSQFWHQDKPGVESSREMFDHFGSALTSGDFNGDGNDELAIGIDGENDRRGAAYILRGSSVGLTPVGDQFWTQDSPGVKNESNVDDYFGSVMTSGDYDGDGFEDWAVAAVREDLGGNAVKNAGLIHVLYGKATGLSADRNQTWHQDSAGIPGIADFQDYFGSAMR